MGPLLDKQEVFVLFISGCICIALGLILWGIGYDYGVVPLGLGIFMMGFWAFIMVVNPELKDYGEERRRRI